MGRVGWNTTKQGIQNSQAYHSLWKSKFNNSRIHLLNHLKLIYIAKINTLGLHAEGILTATSGHVFQKAIWQYLKTSLNLLLQVDQIYSHSLKLQILGIIVYVRIFHGNRLIASCYKQPKCPTRSRCLSRWRPSAVWSARFSPSPPLSVNDSTAHRNPTGKLRLLSLPYSSPPPICASWLVWASNLRLLQVIFRNSARVLILKLESTLKSYSAHPPLPNRP